MACVERWSAEPTCWRNHAWKAELVIYETARNRITEYLNSLHQVTDDGDYNAFSCSGRHCKRRGLLNELRVARKLDLKSILNLDRAGINDARDFRHICNNCLGSSKVSLARFRLSMGTLPL